LNETEELSVNLEYSDRPEKVVDFDIALRTRVNYRVWTENRIFAEDTLLARFFKTGR
jgi:hypothetical protein